MIDSSNRNRTYQHQYNQRARSTSTKPVLPVNDTVVISVHHPVNHRQVYMCEAKIIRQPIYRGGPYKLLITGIKTNLPVGTNDPAILKLLGLKLLRRQDNVTSTKTTHWTRQDTDIWVRLDENTIEKTVGQAVINIRRASYRRKLFR